MTVFDVYLNDRKCCRAGVGADGVLTAIVNWVKLTGPAAARARQLGQPAEESRLHVGGLGGKTHRSWVERKLRVGDRVGVVVATAARADRPRRRTPRTPSVPAQEQTTFLNVDLDLRSSSPLDALVEALGRSVFALHTGREGRRYVAHLETTITSADPNRLIRRFAALVDRLPPRPRRLWDGADLREFNVGIQAAAAPASFALRLHPATVRAAARVNAAIGVTVYGAAPSATPSRRRSRSR